MSVAEEKAGAAGAGLVHYTSKSAESQCERPAGLITAGSSVKIQFCALHLNAFWQPCTSNLLSAAVVISKLGAVRYAAQELHSQMIDSP